MLFLRFKTGKEIGNAAARYTSVRVDEITSIRDGGTSDGEPWCTVHLRGGSYFEVYATRDYVLKHIEKALETWKSSQDILFLHLNA